MMSFQVVQHRLTKVRFLVSPNYNKRPDNSDIRLIVLHNISLPPNEFGGTFIEEFFLNQLDEKAHPYFKKIINLAVSAHLLIKRSGEIIQFVPFHRRAWHAGQSQYKGAKNCNDFSIGIELEGADNIAYEALQYQQLNQVISSLYQAYPIADIVGHNEIACGRKTDPGAAFCWQKIGINK